VNPRTVDLPVDLCPCDRETTLSSFPIAAFGRFDFGCARRRVEAARKSGSNASLQRHGVAIARSRGARETGRWRHPPAT
jgi:hypothetical protein